MKFIKIVLGISAVIVVVAAGVGLLLPAQAHVERSITIAAPPSAVFAMANDFREFNKWSPWFGKDPDAEYQFEGPSSGVGAKMHWSSDQPDVGYGYQEIIESDPNRVVTTFLNFGPKGTAQASVRIEPAGDGSRVTWGFTAKFGNDLLARYFGLLFDSWIGTDYERGLQNLKRLLETGRQ